MQGPISSFSRIQLQHLSVGIAVAIPRRAIALASYQAIGCLAADAACAGIAETISRPISQTYRVRALLLSRLKVRASLLRLGCASACDLAGLSGEQAQGEHAQQQLGCGRGCPGPVQAESGREGE